MLIRSFKNDILIDLNGDGQPDIALVDMMDDGDINAFAADLTGEGEFNFYFIDVGKHAAADIVFLDENGNEKNVKLLGMDQDMVNALEKAAAVLKRALDADDFNSTAVEDAMRALDNEIKRIREDSNATKA